MINKHPFLVLIGEVDDSLIDNAIDLHKDNKTEKKMRITKILIPIAACLVIAIIATVSIVLRRDDEAEKQTDFIVEKGVLFHYLGDDSEIMIPDDVTEISKNAFSDNDFASKITKITTSKVKVNDGAFAGLSNLKCINVVNGAPDWINIDSVFESNVEGLVSNGIGLQYLSNENGMMNYSVTGIDGLELAFADEKDINPLSDSSFPVSLVVSSQGVIESVFQIGMELSDIKIKNIKWDNILIDRTTESYNTIIESNGRRYTYKWKINQDKFSKYAETIDETRNYQNSPELFLEPITDNYPGVLEKIIIDNNMTINRYIFDFDYGSEVRQFALKICFNLPDGWSASEQTDDCTLYYRFDERFDLNVPALEFYTPIYVAADYVLDKNVHSLTKAGDTWQTYNNFCVSTGITEKGYSFVKYDLHTSDDYYAHYYIRLTDNFIVQVYCWEQEANFSNVENVINSMEVDYSAP